MEFPAWLPLERCTACLKFGRPEDGSLGDQQGVSEHWKSLQQKLEVASRQWGLRAADAARDAKAGAAKPEAHRRGPRRGEISLEVGLPNITQAYKWANTGSALGSLKLAIHRVSRQKRAVLQIAKSTVVSCHPSADSNLGKEVWERLRTLLMIDHVNVLAMHEACEDSKWLYLVYDWPEGGLLLDYLTHAHEDITEAHLAGIFREVLGALAAANRFNVHHLDWSLLCFFLSYEGRCSPVKLFGLGLAGSFVPLVTTRDISKSRKHFYVAPELLTDKFATMNHKQLHACDIWSLGTLLYMVFSGRPPFCSSSTEEVKSKIRHGRWSFGHEFDIASRAAKDIIQSMLHKKWETRPSAGELLKHSFMQLQVGQRRKEGVICQDALSKLEDFAKETHCKQTLARLLADLGLQESLYAELESKFKQLDLDGDGVVEIPELLEVAATLEGINHETIESIISTCDRNGNSTVDISEFISAAVLHMENKDERLLVKAFDKIDINRDARITKGEFLRVLRQYSGNLDGSDVSAFVSDLDKDKDNKIDFVEFKNLFPQHEEQDEAVKGRMRSAKIYRTEKKKQFRDLQHKAERFMADLKTVAGKLALEHEKLIKSEHVHGKGILEKVRDVIELIKSFAGKTQSGERKADYPSMQFTKRSSPQSTLLSGLTIMNQYLREGETATAPPRSPAEGEIAVAEPSALASPDAETVVAASVADIDVASKSVAEQYATRGTKARGMTPQQLREEVIRRRKHIWMGGGEGMANLRGAILNRPQDMLVKGRRHKSPRSDGEDSGSNENPLQSERSAGSSGRLRLGGSPRSHHSGSARSGLGSRLSQGGKDPGEGKQKLAVVEEQLTVRAEDEAGGNFPLIPWTTKEKRLKSAEMAMLIATGQPVQKIGLLNERERDEELKRLTKQGLQEHNLHNYTADSLCDLHKLVRLKCVKSWLPPLQVLAEEMEKTLEEAHASAGERRMVYTDGTRFCLQTCERIMFSLTEFILWQEEGFDATWTLEDLVAAPPTTQRFLPHRMDEDDACARTPRDYDDAEALARPVEGVAVGAELDAEIEAANLDGQRSEPGTPAAAAQGVLALTNQASEPAKSPRLDRNLVRMRKGRYDAKNMEKLHIAVMQAKHEAVAGNAALYFE